MIESQREGILNCYTLPSRGSSSPSSIQLDGQCSFDIVVLLAFLLDVWRLAKQGIYINQPQLTVCLRSQQANDLSLSIGKGNDGRSALILVLGCEYRSVLQASEWTKEQKEVFPLVKPVLMLNDATSPGKVLVDVRSLYVGLGL